MKKSRSETALTRRHILSTASKLFLEQGLADTGIASVMTAAGMTQGGFYRHFHSKDELIVEASRMASEDMFEIYQGAVQALPPRAALRTVVDLYLRQAEHEEMNVLCPLPNLGSELRHADVRVRDAAMDGHQRIVKLVGELTAKLHLREPEAVADAIVSTMVGAVMLSRLASTAAAVETIRNSARSGIETLTGDGRAAPLHTKV